MGEHTFKVPEKGTIREASFASDAQEICDVFARRGSTYTLEEMEWHMRPSHVFVLVEEDKGWEEKEEGQIAAKPSPIIRGGVFVCKQGYFWAIGGLIVDPPYQHRGIGTMLMQYVLGLANEADVAVRLVSNVDGIRLYQKLGFERKATSALLVRTLKNPASDQHGEVSHHVNDGDLRFDELITADDMAAINSLSASGTRRCSRDHVNEAHLFRVLGKSCLALLVRDARQVPIGFGAVRKTARFVILGPAVAPSIAIAESILSQLLSRASVDDRFNKAHVAKDGSGKTSAGVDSDSHDAKGNSEEVKVRIDVTSDVDVDGELRDWLVDHHHFQLQEEFPLMEWRARGPSPVDASQHSTGEPSQWALLSPALL